MIIRKGDTVEDVCSRIHRNLIREYRFAQIWGKSVDFKGRKEGLDDKPLIRDILTIVRKVNVL